MRMISRLLLAGLLSGLAGAALAAENGARLADSCTSCHGLEGRSVGAVPALAGQDEETLLARLLEFKTGTAEVTIMNRLARGYTDEELAALAAYFSAVTPAPEAAP